MFREYVQNIAMVIIFTSFLGLILPGSKHKGYIKLIAGLVVILAVISPVAVFFTGNNLEEFFVSAERQLGFDIAARTIQSGGHFEDIMLRAVLDEHRAGLEAGMRKKISNLGYELRDSRIYIDESDENFGMIAALALTLSPKVDEPERGLIRVERVSIERIGINMPGMESGDDCPEINAIKNLLADFYNLSVANIHITVTGE